ncbi:MAG: DUF4011 domain-containing protein [Fibrella sp.]|nr:DUF4011 domain-containing protein [Armatimonadota bacterium]
MPLPISDDETSTVPHTLTDTQVPADSLMPEAMDTWKNALLGSTRANTLLHLPDTGTVDVGMPNAFAEVCSLLFLRRKPVTLWDVRADSFTRAVIQQPGNYHASPAALETLRHLHIQVENLFKSQDVSLLFLAAGVLAWKDEQSGESFRSPLLLVPVTLERSDAGANYVLSRVEQSVEINPLLRQHLAQEKTDFVLPPLPEESYLVASAYLAQVAALVEGRDGWEVETRCLLGRFPLFKMRLHEDLTQHEERVQSHPFIRALAGNVGALEKLTVASPDPVLNPNDSTPVLQASFFQLLDADPDQERAIDAAVRGQSFVLQGPPGTGKTQTITNIIGECVASGKSVLLVSGRVSSLEAVHQRLTDKGLGDLCLVAHSTTTNKRDIFQQLSQSLNLLATTSPSGSDGAKLSSSEHQELERLREELEAVVQELHRVRQPLGSSLYDAYGMIAQAENRDPLRSEWAQHLAATMEGVEGVSEPEYRRQEDAVARLTQHPLWTRIPDNAIWHGAFKQSISVQAQASFQNALADTLAALYRVQHAAASLSRRCGWEPPQGPRDVEQLLQTVRLLLAASPHCLWLLGQNSDDLTTSTRLSRYREQVTQLFARETELRSAQDALLERYSAAILRLPPEQTTELIERMTKRQEAVLLPLLGKDWQDTAINAAQKGGLCEVLDSLRATCERLHAEVLFLADACGVSPAKIPDVLTPSGDLRTLLRVAAVAGEIPAFCAGWLASKDGVSRRRKLGDEAERRWKQWGEQTAELFAGYEEEILTLDHAALLASLVAPATGLNRLVNIDALRSRRVLQGVKRPGDSDAERDVVADLKLAQQARANQLWLEEHAASFTDAFGPVYQNEATDWVFLNNLLDGAESLCIAAATGGLLTSNDTGEVSAAFVSRVAESDNFRTNAWKGRIESVARMLVYTESVLDRLVVLADTLPSSQLSFAGIARWCEMHCQSLRDQCEAVSVAASLRLPATAVAAPQEDEYPAVATLIADLINANLLQVVEANLSKESSLLAPTLCGPFLQSEAVNWEAVGAVIEQAEGIHASFKEAGRTLTASLLDMLSKDDDMTQHSTLLLEQLTLRQEWEAMESALAGSTAWFQPAYARIDSQPLADAPFSALASWIKVRQYHAEQIPRIQSVLAVRSECAAAGLTDFFDGLSGRPGEVLPPHIGLPVFRAAFHRAWVNTVIARTPVLQAFNGVEHSQKIERFRALDRRMMEEAPRKIRQTMKGTRAKQALRSEVNLLAGQLARRRIGEVRTLLAQIPGLLLALKPCIMMNPLSVRLFLDPDAIMFDVVLFDDASQIATEEALGAIARGRQVIIAGDSQQIPPLPLMTEVQNVRESILDAANTLVARGSCAFQQFALNWHYRSQHESLIAYSRRYFYPDLVAFPSASRRSALEMVVLPGADADDAGAVVDALLAYVRREPSHSVGVVVLDETAQISLINEIARRKTDGGDNAGATDVKQLCETESRGFFIKTIENVQGDERDMMLLTLPSNPSRWGILNQPGARFLLNVAVTRARRHMIVAASLTPPFATVANKKKTSPAGTILAQFLGVVQETIQGNGGDSAARQGQERKGTYEHLIPVDLEEKGYPFSRNVGTAECQISFALSDPDSHDRYLLGILCDGPSYARGGTARQRDRQLPDMLRERGWDLRRVWSQDCYQKPEEQKRTIKDACSDAIRVSKVSRAK